MLFQHQRQVGCFDFFTNFPGLNAPNRKVHLTPVTVTFSSSQQDFLVGADSVAVPGTLKGLLEFHERWGQLPLKKLLKPIIEFARKGVSLNSTQSYVLGLLEPILQRTETGKRLYFKGNRLLKHGDDFINPEFANFLENFEENCLSFYTGLLGDRTLDQFGSEPWLSKTDLESYRPELRDPLSFLYNESTLYTVPVPSHGGHYLKVLFALLEKHNISQKPWGGIEHLKAIADTLIELENGKSSAEFHPFTKGTTHISISDSFDNHVSMSLTNGEGSGVFIPESGIMLNNMLGEDDLCSHDPQYWRPGQRLPSMMAPCLVRRNEAPLLVTGSGGSKRIRSSLLQVISHILDFDGNLQDAIQAPRLNWDGEALQLEPGFSEDVVTELKKSYPVNEWPQLEFYFGGTHSVLEKTAAAGDPRRGGSSWFS